MWSSRALQILHSILMHTMYIGEMQFEVFSSVFITVLCFSYLHTILFCCSITNLIIWAPNWDFSGNMQLKTATGQVPCKNLRNQCCSSTLRLNLCFVSTPTYRDPQVPKFTSERPGSFCKPMHLSTQQMIWHVGQQSYVLEEGLGIGALADCNPWQGLMLIKGSTQHFSN